GPSSIRKIPALGWCATRLREGEEYERSRPSDFLLVPIAPRVQRPGTVSVKYRPHWSNQCSKWIRAARPPNLAFLAANVITPRMRLNLGRESVATRSDALFSFCDQPRR